MTTFSYALAQFNPTVGDIDGNAERIHELIQSSAGVDLTVFPELALSGYPPEDLLFKHHFLADVRQALDRIAASITSGVAVIGFPESYQERIYNSAAVIRAGALEAIYRKHFLPNYGVFDEQRYFTPGEEKVIFELNGHQVGVTVCEDIWVGGDLLQALVDDGAELILNLSASPYHRGKGIERERLVSDRATQYGVPIALCNMIGGQDELVFDGHSCVADPAGEVVARAPQFKQSLLRGVFPLDSEGEDSSTLADPVSPLQEIYAALKLGLHDYVLKNGFEHAVLGLSGGIDSALVACIAVDALGKDRVTCVVMPSPHSSEGTQSDARKLASNLGTELLEFPIEKEMETYEQALRDVFRGREADITEENLQARIRANLLMALSNKFGWLVLTTGNKSEISVGYSTLYGDAAGGFSVIKDCPKTLVYELSRERNQQPDSPIPQSIIERAPSAELRPDQRDQDSLPPYDLLDRILEGYVEEYKGLDDLVAEGLPETEVERVIQLVDHAEYKRRQGVPGVKITPLAFGRDRRMPITNRYRG